MADTSNDATVIGADTHIKGELTFQKTIRVVGTIDGSVTGEGELQVAKGAACKAQVDAGRVVIDGIVDGNVLARDTVQLNASGVVKGDIVAGKMVMAEGASFFGKCAVGPEAVKAAGGATGSATSSASASANAGSSKPATATRQPEPARGK